MSEASNERIDEIFLAALECGPRERHAYLDEVCGDDEALLTRVENLLTAHAEAEEILPDPPQSTVVLPGPDPAHGLEGQRIGRYLIRRLIASGGMGTVYEAEQEQPRRTVALKVLRAGLLSSSAKRRFEYESQILARLRHPNIAQVYEAGMHEAEVGPIPYFAMEYIPDARTITQYADEERLYNPQRLELLAKVCDAVQHGHQNSVIHRDLTPRNILVDADGEPKIIDFGVARLTGVDADITTRYTDLGQLIGTISYMSPEQAAGRADDLDTRSDVYALGVLGYELLSGQLPYDVRKKMIHEAVRVIREDDPMPLSAINRIFRGDVETIISKALEKEKIKRYQSASELATDIRRYLHDEPIIARPQSTWYQLHKFARRNRPVVLAGIIVAVALVTATGVSIGFALSEGVQRTLAEKREQEARTQAQIAEAVNSFLNDDLLAAVAPSAEQGKGKDVLMREVLDEAAKRIEEASAAGGRFADKPLVEASIRMALGITYRHLGEYDAAEPHLERARMLRHRELGAQHPDTLNSMHNLTVLYLYQGRHDEAEPQLIKTLEIRKRVLREEHPDTLNSMNNLAFLYRNQGRHYEAEPLYLETLQIRKRLLGEEHPDTLNSMNNLAILYVDQGQYDEAEPLHVNTLEIQKRVLGEEHPNTLDTMNSLARLYLNLGRYAEAEPQMIKTLEIRKRLLGEEHPDTLGAITNLGNLYVSMKRFDDARGMFETSLPIKRRVLGMNHPWTQFALRGLAQAYDGLKRPEKAIPLWRELQVHQLAQAEKPDASVRVIYEAAWGLLTTKIAALRDPARALPLARRAVDESGGADPDVLHALARAQFMTGDIAGAVETEKKALSLLPADAAGRDEFEAALARFEAAPAEQHALDNEEETVPAAGDPDDP